MSYFLLACRELLLAQAFPFPRDFLCLQAAKLAIVMTHIRAGLFILAFFTAHMPFLRTGEVDVEHATFFQYVSLLSSLLSYSPGGAGWRRSCR